MAHYHETMVSWDVVGLSPEGSVADPEKPIVLPEEMPRPEEDPAPEEEPKREGEPEPEPVGTTR